MKVSIIIPVRNEQNGIRRAVEQLQNKLNNFPYEVIFINDFSEDNTKNVLEEIIKTKAQFNLYDNKKRGLGGAIAEGINRSNGDSICIMMSDLSDNLDDLEKYYSIIKNENVDAVFGSRFIKNSMIIDSLS